MFHDAVELVKALAWPAVVVFFGIRFFPQLQSLLNELPSVMRRVQSAHGLGINVELNKIGEELPFVERQAPTLSLKLPDVPHATELQRGRYGKS